MHTFDENIVSDLHKDARGFRPGEFWWQYWNDADDARKQEIWDSLCEELDEEMAREAEQQLYALSMFSATVNDMMVANNISWSTAVRWLIQAEDCEQARHDFSYFLYYYGICNMRVEAQLWNMYQGDA